MTYTLQEGLFRENHETRLIDVIERLKLPLYYFKHIPFTEDLQWIQFEDSEYVNVDRQLRYSTKGTRPTDSNTMVFGSVRVSHFANKYGWTPGSFYNDNHDYTVYSKHWGENMLNHDSRIQKMSDPINEEFFFARPTGDNKIFKGELYGKAMWEFTVNHGITNGADPNTLIQVCSPKEIMQEVRCFVIKGKVITASFYKIGDRVVYQRCTDDDIISFAQEMVDTFQLSDAFVIDVCRTNKGLKIVECNCINCSGFYDIDVQKLIEKLEENFTL